jgi:hypothetical protein
MVVRKITVSLEENAYEAAVRAAKAAGLSLSAWLSRYAEHRARVEEGLRAAAAYEAEYGPPTLAEVGSADAILDELGVGQPVPATKDSAYAAALHRLRDHTDAASTGAVLDEPDLVPGKSARAA